MTLVSGTRLGAYQIVDSLGAGGMGEVYRATDTRLKRQVAVKILPSSVASEPDRLARFQREAEILASLNHPNIAVIYGLEDAGGTKALVMELVEGPTLADRIAEGAIPVDEAIPIARQIAEALEAAHEQGIIHRDLKPANIKLRADGAVKVLDFGLAKAFGEAPGPGPADSQTITSPSMTLQGMILGTAAYMSPEQSKGKPLDKRSDIWAFGCVLYEMLTGKPAFGGADLSDIMASVLKSEIDWQALPVAAPVSVRRLLQRCLQKDPKLRLRDIGDARHELADPLFVDLPQPGESQPRRARSPLLLAGAIGLLAGSAIAILLGLAWMRFGRPPVDVVRLSVSLGPATELLPTSPSEPDRLTRHAVAISPDGRQIVFSAARNGQPSLFVRALNVLVATPLAGTDGAVAPFFSPSGTSIGFWVGGELRRMPIAGGPSVVVTRITRSVVPFGASWGDDDRIVYAPASGEGLWEVAVSGGTAQQLTSLDRSRGEVTHRLPHVLPGGDTVLFTVTRNRFARWDQTEVSAFSRKTRSIKRVIAGGADARFVPSGHLLFMREGLLMAVRFDVDRAEVIGDPMAAVGDVMQAAYHTGSDSDSGSGQFSVSNTGTLVYAPGGVVPEGDRRLVLVDRSGNVEALRMAAGSIGQARLSPDGRLVAWYTDGRTQDIWIFDLARQRSARLTTDGRSGLPVWTPDGTRVVYRSAVSGPDNLFWRFADGSGTAERLTTHERNQVPAGWSPNGDALLFYELNETSADIFVMSMGSERRTEPLLNTSADETGADISPNGRWLAYASNETGRAEVYVQPYGKPGGKILVSAAGGHSPIWARDGRELFYLAPASVGLTVMAVPVRTDPDFDAGSPKALFTGRFNAPSLRGWDAMPDGRRFLMVRPGEAVRTPVNQLVVILDWFAELKRVVPTN